MPNKANRSNGKSSAGKGSPRHEPNRDRGTQRSNNERSDVKHGTDKAADNNTSRTSSEGRKQASGGNAE